MLLVVDIGNTNITLGVFDNDERKMIARMATLVNKTADQYAVELIQILNIYDVSKEDIDGCIVSSVVPVVTNAIKKALSLIKVKKTLSLGLSSLK